MELDSLESTAYPGQTCDPSQNYCGMLAVKFFVWPLLTHGVPIFEQVFNSCHGSEEQPFLFLTSRLVAMAKVATSPILTTNGRYETFLLQTEQLVTTTGSIEPPLGDQH